MTPAPFNDAAQLFPLVYDELRALAAAKLSHEKPGQTLQATALVHEAYLRLAANDPHQPWDGRGHFFAAAAEAMRRILIDHARGRKRQKRGGNLDRVTLADLDDAELQVSGDDSGPDILALDDALTKLAQNRPELTELVRLRFFTGLTVAQAADVLGVSQSTAERNWTYARAWLYQELATGGDDEIGDRNP